MSNSLTFEQKLDNYVPPMRPVMRKELESFIRDEIQKAKAEITDFYENILNKPEIKEILEVKKSVKMLKKLINSKKKLTVFDQKGNKKLEIGEIGKGRFKYGIRRYK